MPHARYETNGDVGEIVLSNPPLNLFDATLMAELRTAVDEAASAAPRALIVRAEGKVFTAGVDVHVFEGLDIPAADALTGSLLELAHTLEDMPFPTIAAVHGLVPHRRPGDLTGVRSAVGLRGRALRTGGEGGRHHPADGRNPADGRACRDGAREGVRVLRRAV